MDRPTIKATITVMFQEEKHDVSLGTHQDEPHDKVQSDPSGCKRQRIQIDEGTADADTTEQTRIIGAEREKEDVDAVQAAKDDFDAYSYRIVEEHPNPPHDS